MRIGQHFPGAMELEWISHHTALIQNHRGDPSILSRLKAPSERRYPISDAARHAAAVNDENVRVSFRKVMQFTGEQPFRTAVEHRYANRYQRSVLSFNYGPGCSQHCTGSSAVNRWRYNGRERERLLDEPTDSRDLS